MNPRMARPPQGNVVIMHHVVSVHKSDGNYKRRLIRFWNDEALPVRGVALVEYVGEEPEVIVPHENSTRNVDPYIRTHPNEFEEIRAAELCVTNKRLYDRLTESNNADCPRNTRQITDARYWSKKKGGAVGHALSMIADDYAALYALMNSAGIMH